MPLFIVSTPIGNLNDITIRALEILKNSDIIFAEDTRVADFLLKRHEIKNKKIINFTDHTKENEYLSFLELAKTQNICLTSDAGTPLIADPGYKIVTKALELGIKVVPIPGASSVTSAISVSGLPFSKFTFLGFYEKHKISEIKSILEKEISVVLFIPGRDILTALEEMQDLLINRKISIARELTKIFEDIKTGKFNEVKNYYSDTAKLKGEAVFMISFLLEKEKDLDIKEIIKEILETKPFLKPFRAKELSEILKQYEPNLKHFSKKEIYKELLHWNKKSDPKRVT